MATCGSGTPFGMLASPVMQVPLGKRASHMYVLSYFAHVSRLVRNGFPLTIYLPSSLTLDFVLPVGRVHGAECKQRSAVVRSPIGFSTTTDFAECKSTPQAARGYIAE